MVLLHYLKLARQALENDKITIEGMAYLISQYLDNHVIRELINRSGKPISLGGRISDSITFCSEGLEVKLNELPNRPSDSRVNYPPVPWGSTPEQLMEICGIMYKRNKVPLREFYWQIEQNFAAAASKFANSQGLEEQIQKAQMASRSVKPEEYAQSYRKFVAEASRYFGHA
ncbi:hypothetical protein HYU11_03820 [Candidatus Woesearchaeota archaeon]|nr:hypothetical protein [Candidatus Woesearchaeota archaeon]